MDLKTLQWMADRVEKSNSILKEIEYRKEILERLGTEVTGIFFYTNKSNAEFDSKNRKHEFGFCSRVKIEAAKILLEEIDILEDKLEGI